MLPLKFAIAGPAGAVPETIPVPQYGHGAPRHRLYGYYPAPEMEGLDGPGLRPVMTVKSRIAAVRALPAGTCVSYGRTAVLKRDSKLAVVPIGYGDGYPRCLSNQMVMGNFTGVPCPIDGPGVYGYVHGGRHRPARRKAGRCGGGLRPRPDPEGRDLVGTIVYELLCDVNPRVPRVYLP